MEFCCSEKSAWGNAGNVPLWVFFVFRSIIFELTIPSAFCFEYLSNDSELFVEAKFTGRLEFEGVTLIVPKGRGFNLIYGMYRSGVNAIEWNVNGMEWVTASCFFLFFSEVGSNLKCSFLTKVIRQLLLNQLRSTSTQRIQTILPKRQSYFYFILLINFTEML